MRQVALFIFLLLSSLIYGCDRIVGQAVSSDVQPKLAKTDLPMETSNLVSCKASELFTSRTGIPRLEIRVRTAFESTFDEKRNKNIRYPVSLDVVSARAIASSGHAVSLTDIENSGSIEVEDPKSICSNFKYLVAGQYGVITHFLGTGNPYPIEQQWFIHAKSRKLVPSTDVIGEHDFLEQAGPECLETRVRGSASDPGVHNVWCANNSLGKLKWVRRLMVLDQEERVIKYEIGNEDVQNYYWFDCDRSTGVGQVLKKAHEISLGEHGTVSDPKISSRMDIECSKWANER